VQLDTSHVECDVLMNRHPVTAGHRLSEARTIERDSGRLVVFAASISAAFAGVIICTLLRT
jgi:hypothetical protein